MKIAITADIHYAPKFATMQFTPRFTSKAILQSMMVRMLSREPDLIVLAGDIGETQVNKNYFRKALQVITGVCDSDAHIAAVLGNHDIWSNDHPTSLELWETTLPQVMKEEIVWNLENKNWVKDGVAVIGSYLHYDYSSQDDKGLAVENIHNRFPDLTTEEFEERFRCTRNDFQKLSLEQYYARYKYLANNDGKYLVGLPPDPIFSRQIGEGFRKRLQAAEDDPAVHSIVIVTHVPCMYCQITRHPYNLGWSIGTPYFGNLSHEDFIRGLTKVKHVVSAHSHNKEHSVVTFNDGHEVPVQVIESEYGNPTSIIVEV